MRRSSPFFFAVAISVTLTRVASAQILNGGFETGSLSPWFNDRNFCGGICAPWAVISADAHTGTYSAEATGNIEIRQNFAPIFTSDVSAFTFWVRHPDLATAPMYVSFFYTDASQSNQLLLSTSSDWQQFDVTSMLTAGKQVDGFSIFGYDPNGVTRLDDVLMTSAVPEPATMALLATGLLGIVGAGYRRRRA